MVKTYQDLKEKSLGMIAFFETSNSYPECYGITAGNWDDAGISHGVLQYNFKTGSLQTLWNHMNNNHNALCRGIFGTDYDEWAGMINATLLTQQTWGTNIGDPATGRHSCLEPWKSYFMELGTSQESIDKQIEMSGSWHTNALKWFNNLGLYSRRGYALMFDISVQMGRFLPQNVCLDRFRQIDETDKTRMQIENEKLNIIVELCSNGNNRCFPTETLPTLPQIVFDRKNAVVVGSSVQGFSIGQYDLEYEPAFQGGIFSGIPIAGKPIVQETILYNAVRLDWEPTPNTTSYKIYRTTNIENLGAMLQEITDGTTTFTDATAIGGTTYYYTVKAVNDWNATNSDKITAIPSSIVTYEDRMIDFIGYTAYQVYDATAVTNDFGNVDTLQGDTRLKIDTSERLRFEMPVDQLGSANTGGIIKAKIVPKNEYTLEYEIRFDNLFPWSKGGKVAGMSGGKGYTGGEGALARTGDGWSVRMMWREDGRIIPYVYHALMDGDYGDTFGLTLGYFTYTQPHKVKYYIKLNTGSDQNGILQIWLDDVQIMNKTDLCYRTDNSKIDTCHVAIFAGGSTVDWNMQGSSYIRLSYIKWV